MTRGGDVPELRKAARGSSSGLGENSYDKDKTIIYDPL